MTRYLIVNADDFGQSPGINAGVIQAHEHGVVTSTSLMVRWPAAKQAVRLAADHPRMSLGLHVDLGQWSCSDGQWTADYRVVDDRDEEAIAEEVGRQVSAFHDLVGSPPTHLDGHQHVQASPPASTVLAAAAEALGVPLRLHSAIAYSGILYGQTGRGEPYPEALTVESVLHAIDGLDPGWHELGCHPGLGDDAPGVYRSERTIETRVLCDPALRDGLSARGAELRSFAGVTPAGAQPGGAAPAEVSRRASSRSSPGQRPRST